MRKATMSARARARWASGFAVIAVGAVGVFSSARTAQASDALTAAQIRQIIQPAPNIVAMPPIELARRIRASIDPNVVGNLTYHNGPVMQAANNSVPIFWIPTHVQDGSATAPSANYISLVERYFDDMGYSPLNQIATQYYQVVKGTKTFILNNSYRIMAVVDTSAYPAAGPGCAGNGVDCVDDAQIRNKIVSVSTAHSLPQDLNTEYYVFLAPHESTCTVPTNCFKSDKVTTANFNFCAYHSFLTTNGKFVVYANMPYGAYPAAGLGCTGLGSFPNDRDADIEISTTSHEQSESTTDPIPPTGWYFGDLAHENGDECAYNYGTLGLDGGKANEQWNGHYYVVQQEWSNAISGCSQGVTVPPSPIVAQLGGASVYEGDSGSHTIELPVTLNMPAGSLVKVNYNVLKGPTDTASVGSDFLASAGTLTFLPTYSGHTATTAQIPVTILGDTTTEASETFTVQLTSATGARLGANKLSRGLIVNDDPESGLQLTVSNVGIVEGNSIAPGAPANSMQFHVHLSAPVPALHTVTVKYTVLGVTANGGLFALPGVDFRYTPSPVLLAFSAGQSDKVITVSVFADKTVEPNETLRLALSSATGASIKTVSGTGTIINDD